MKKDLNNVFKVLRRDGVVYTDAIDAREEEKFVIDYCRWIADQESQDFDLDDVTIEIKFFDLGDGKSRITSR